MTKEKQKLIHLIYGIALSITVVIAAICLILECYGIYKSDSFSRENVAAAFSGTAVPVYLCLAFVVGGFILNLFLPLEKKKTTPGGDVVFLLESLKSRADCSGCSEETALTLNRLRKTRAIHKIITVALLTICSAVFLVYALDPGNFHQSDINSSMIKAVLILCLCLVSPFLYAIFTAYHCRLSIKKETEILKAIISSGETTGNNSFVKDSMAAAEEKENEYKTIKTIVLWALIAAGVALIVYGAMQGGTADVLTKAKNICTECIGLG